MENPEMNADGKMDREATTLLAFVALMAIVWIVALLCGGCATKTRSVDLDGMYLSEAGTLAIGSVEVQSAPVGEETAAIRYTEDTAWLSPAVKTHEIRILLTGTNSVASAEAICASICDAFVRTAPQKGGAPDALEHPAVGDATQGE